MCSRHTLPIGSERSTSVGNPLQSKGWTIQSLVGYVSLSEDAKPIALVDVQAPPSKPPPHGRPDPAAAAVALAEARAKTKFAGLVARQSGAGWAGYCSATLWSHWDPSDPFFQAFIGDLWAPRARYALRPTAGAPVEISGEDQALHLLNTGAQTVLADVAVLTADNRLYACGIAQVPALPERVTAPVLMIVTAELKPGALVTLPRVPVVLLPDGEGGLAYLKQYRPAGLTLLVAGPGALLTLDFDKSRTFTLGRPLTARVVIENGDYAVAPGSRHQVTIDSGFGHKSTSVMPADDQGRLSFTLTGGKVKVEVAPAPAPATE